MRYNNGMNTKKLSVCTLIFLIGAFLVSACGGTAAAEPTQDNASIIATSIQQTMQSLQETQSAAPTPTQANTPTSPSTGAEAPTLAVVSPPTAIPTAMSTNCLVAGLVSETYPDNTLVAKGAKFTKTWRVINGGTCAWTTAYKFVFVSGYDLGAKKEIPLPENIPPGGITNINLEMTAPNADGTYIGNWALFTNTGVLVGNYSVKIIVGTAPFAVTSVSIALNDQTIVCTSPFYVPVSITSSGAGTVRYKITTTYNKTGDPTTTVEKIDDIVFTSAGTMTVNSSSITLSPPAISGDLFDYDVSVYILLPNNQGFGKKEADLKCQ